MGAGAEWDEAILDAIERCRAYLLILSAHANQSSFVKNELNRAFSCGKAIVTFRIEDVLPGRSLELYLARHHWTDAFPPPLEPRVEQLASSLTRLLNPSVDGSAEVPTAVVAQAPAPAHIPIVDPAIVAKTTATADRTAGRRAWMTAFAIAVVAAATLAAPALRHLGETPPPEMRLDIVTPASSNPSGFALSPDGRQIVYVAAENGRSRLWLRSLSSTAAVPLDGTEDAISPFWSPDGRFVLYHAVDAVTGSDLWVLPMAGSRTPTAWLRTRFNERSAALSPDGCWVAYASDASGRYEIYVRPFVPPGTADANADRSASQWQASTAGGISPAWRPDGKELYYLNSAGAMMAVPIRIAGATLEPGAPAELFPTRILGGGVGTGAGRQYDVAPDGRFLINTLSEATSAAPITLILSWNPDGK